MNADQQTPFDRLFVQDADDRPDEIVVDELTTMDAEAFVAQLDAARLTCFAWFVSNISRQRQRL